MAQADINTHGLKMPYGKHQGMLVTRVPVGYLKWMIKSRHDWADVAQAELTRRGISLTDAELDISGHAVDRASLSCRKIWHHSKMPDEGLHAWLVRMTREALAANTKDDAGRYLHNGLKLAIEMDEAWPTLKTVMPGNDFKPDDKEQQT